MGAIAFGTLAASLPAAVAVPVVCCDVGKFSARDIFENRVHRLSGKVSEIDNRMKTASSRELGQLRKARDFFQNNHSLALSTIEVKYTHTHYHV